MECECGKNGSEERNGGMGKEERDGTVGFRFFFLKITIQSLLRFFDLLTNHLGH